jgi:putative endonuclease
MNYYVYILRSLKNGSYYKGQTSDINQRLLEHNSGITPSTKRYMPWELVWFTEVPTREDALRLEQKLKNITSRARLEDFIKRNTSDDVTLL